MKAGAMAKLKLTRFNLTDKIVTEEGKPTTVFLRWINDNISAIQAFLNDQAQLVDDITTALTNAGIAILTAKEAKAAALAQTKAANLTNSYVTPSTALTAAIDTSDSTKAMITIANHQRIYGDGTIVNVSGAVLTGLSLGTQYYIVYTDVARAGGAVTYTALTNADAAGQAGDQHLVGGITTPAADGTGGGHGGTTRPPGVPSWKFPDLEPEDGA